MTPEMEFLKYIWENLQGIRRIDLYRNHPLGFQYSIKKSDNKKDAKELLFERFEKWGIVKNYKKRDDASFAFQLSQPKFNNVYEQFDSFFGMIDYKYKNREKFMMIPTEEKDSLLKAIENNFDNVNQAKPNEKESFDNRPYCITDKGLGYIKFGKYAKNIKISKTTSQPFKLLQCLTEPVGIAKSIDTVFEAIRENLLEKSRTGIYQKSIDRNKKIEMIGYAIKEIQKNKELKGMISFKWDNPKTKIWIECL